MSHCQTSPAAQAAAPLTYCTLSVALQGPTVTVVHADFHVIYLQSLPPFKSHILQYAVPMRGHLF